MGSDKANDTGAIFSVSSPTIFPWGTAAAGKDREIADYMRRSAERTAGLTLGQLCGANMTKLDVACHCCSRKGRYTVTRLIDRHGPNILLSDLKGILSVDCNTRVSIKQLSQALNTPSPPSPKTR